MKHKDQSSVFQVVPFSYFSVPQLFSSKPISDTNDAKCSQTDSDTQSPDIFDRCQCYCALPVFLLCMFCQVKSIKVHTCAFVHCSYGKLPFYYWTFRKLLLGLAVGAAERGHQLPLFLVFSHLSQALSSFVLSSICFRFPALITHYCRSKSTFLHTIP